jgi:RNA polymerase sigma-70 factor (ECF subfamily)
MHYRLLHRYVACRIGDAAEVDDVLQEVLLLAWLSIGKLNNPGALKAWLMRIAANCCYKWYKARSAGDHPIENEELTSLIDRKHSIHDESDDHEQLLTALDKLPEKQKRAIEEFYFGNLKISEIAFVHNLPEGTVKRRLHDGRLGLKKELEGMEHEQI